MSHDLPDLVRQAHQQAAATGFTMSCEPETGRLLAVLAAAVPPGGRILELGTGTGVGTAWLVAGLHGRGDVEVLTVENDPGTAALVRAVPWPAFVKLINGDATDVTRRSGTFDLIFADAPAGKWHGLEKTIAALRPGGRLVVDDMTPTRYIDDTHRHKTNQVREHLHSHPELTTVEIAWSTGLILSTRHHT